MKPIFLRGLALLLILTSTTSAQENQELGRMWTFENPPLTYLEKKYGFKPDQEWLNSLRLGSLRLGGEDVLSGLGSASFVSPKGLILTSARCVRDAVTTTRPNGLDIINTGFVAAAQEDESRLRTWQNGWLAAAQLIKISNVTNEVNEGALPTDDEIQIKEKREANEKTILDAARNVDPQLVPQIVSFYQGAIFRLYQYKVYKDIRLVVLPHVQTAHFGGDLDNFTYPRHSLDFAFLRAYEDGKPADTTKHYFGWKPGGATKDELVFVSGTPRTTNRLLTKAQLELERDIRIPMKIEQLTNELRISMEDPRGLRADAHWAAARLRALELETSVKAARGNLNALMDANLMAQKTAAEKAFKGRVMADKELVEKYGDLWDRIASVVKQRRLHEPRARFHTAGDFVLAVAIDIVRSCDPTETEKHRKQAKKSLEAWAGATIAPNYYATVAVLDHFDRARNWLPNDDPFFTKVLGGKNSKEFLDAMTPPESLRSPSWLGYPAPRNALVKSGWKAIQDSDDPAIVAARELIILMRKHEKISEELDAKEEALGAEMGRALFACYGAVVGPDGVSPDATMTLRFTDGIVRGFPFNGTIAPHRTTFYGLYGRNACFDDEYPFNLPQIWHDRKDEIDMRKSVNFVSTNDITNGDSGSVVVNKELEIVGVVVDGTIESLQNDFVFRSDVPRAVSAHVDGIMEALVKIYEASRVAKELTGK